MTNITNKKGWPCVLYRRETMPDGTLREKFIYRNPDDPEEAEIELVDLKPVTLEGVRIRISLAPDDRQLLLPIPEEL